MDILLYRFLLGLCAAASAAAVSCLLSYSSYGFDFTDEGFYLNMLANPWAYDWSVSQFGFVYYPAYVLLGGDISSLRVLNIVLTFGLATAVGLELLQRSGSPSESRTQVFLLSISLAATALICFDSWLVTPNYDTLAFQGLLITSLGLIGGMMRSWSKFSTFLVALGLYVVFLAKPTSATAGALVITCAILFPKRGNWRALLVIVLLGLCFLVAGALLIDGSIRSHVERFQVGAHFAQLLGGGYATSQILRLDSFHFTKDERLATLIVTLAVAGMSVVMARPRGIAAHLCVALVCLLMLATGYLCGAVSAPSLITLGEFRGLMVGGVPAGALLAVFFLRRQVHSESIRRKFVIPLVFFVIPWIYAFGTNGNYWHKASSAVVFWVFAAVAVLQATAKDRLKVCCVIPIACASVAITMTLIKFGPTSPYRQPHPLSWNDHEVAIRTTANTLTLWRGYAEYIGAASASAKKSGFMQGTSVIDLSGQSPGLVYVLSGRNLAQGWTIGGYPGSAQLAAAALLRVSCDDIASAWVLNEPGGPRSLPSDLLGGFGGDLTVHYERVGMWQVASGAGGYDARGSQHLYKPVAQQKVEELCEEHRRTK